MEANWTREAAQIMLESTVPVLVDTVLLVTTDSVQVFDSAMMKRVGPWYLVWTEHHGRFLEHEDEVYDCRVYRRIG